MFGPHLVLEGYNCKKKDDLGNKDLLKNILEEFPEKLDMTIIMPPKVMHYDGGEIPEDSGTSGFVIIAESHIAIHTFPEKGFFTLDIFSCKPFDIDAAIDFVKQKYEPEYIDKKIFERGREFPRSLGRASQIINSERTDILTSKELTKV
ncbi:MAG: adenosylmethionine decarboxylase [Candidatus Caenarcaniphilales bacterium]|nr:adenosylmethionine decarboxylase [Candidatus Caenarcaniphilales bacterium]